MSTFHMIDINKAKRAYKRQRDRAKIREIGWDFTFDTWMQWWIDSGVWDQRGKGTDQYCMCRIGDVGPYSPDNVFAGTNRNNLSGGASKPKSEEHVAKVAKSLTGKKRTSEQIQRIKDNRPMKRKVSINGIVYSSLTEASEATNIPISTIYRKLRSDPAFQYIS